MFYCLTFANQPITFTKTNVVKLSALFLSCLRCPSSWIQYLSPLFELDPLFRRTFLLVVPVKEFGKIAFSGAFTPAEIYTTLAKGLLEKGHILQNCPEVTVLVILTLNLARLLFCGKRYVKFESITLHWHPGLKAKLSTIFIMFAQTKYKVV